MRVNENDSCLHGGKSNSIDSRKLGAVPPSQLCFAAISQWSASSRCE